MRRGEQLPDSESLLSEELERLQLQLQLQLQLLLLLLLLHDELLLLTLRCEGQPGPGAATGLTVNKKNKVYFTLSGSHVEVTL